MYIYIDIFCFAHTDTCTYINIQHIHLYLYIFIYRHTQLSFQLRPASAGNTHCLPVISIPIHTRLRAKLNIGTCNVKPFTAFFWLHLKWTISNVMDFIQLPC